ncbi:MAG: hypothetical protein MZU79_02520 [Anaerotruncus sp.]|nr:hypothetical protein [Anaerotruncus sp.]
MMAAIQGRGPGDGAVGTGSPIEPGPPAADRFSGSRRPPASARARGRAPRASSPTRKPRDPPFT